MLLAVKLGESVGWKCMEVHFSDPPRFPVDIGTSFRCNAMLHLWGAFRRASVCNAFEAWPVSSFIPGKPIANIHLCAGVFSGWHDKDGLSSMELSLSLP